MAETQAQKRDRFARIFPARVEKLIKALDVLENCSSKSNYDFDEDLVKRCWIEIGKQFSHVASSFDVDLHILLDGRDIKHIDTSKEVKP